ncbi:thioredoxin family protein [Christiangramia aquimixticola]|uniref:thioredoxin family protein n=1 Tax=Christiangramia aquimixticola TaxID=1697558 RepID=UPI003AA99C18
MKLIFKILFLLSLQAGFAQKSEIDWMDFETLDAALTVQPKPVFIYFNADWCVYCKKMERNAFRDPEVISLLNKKFYAVKMNAESTDEIRFDGQTFRNVQAKTMRNGIHELPLLLASRKDQKFTLPALLLLDQNFQIKLRSFQYLTTAELLKFLAKIDKKTTQRN